LLNYVKCATAICQDQKHVFLFSVVTRTLGAIHSYSVLNFTYLTMTMLYDLKS